MTRMYHPIAVATLAVFMALGGLLCGIAIMAVRGHKAVCVAAEPRKATSEWVTHDPGQLDSDWQKLQSIWEVVAIETESEKLAVNNVMSFRSRLFLRGRSASCNRRPGFSGSILASHRA
jgi:hypothetical protein